MVMVQEAHLPAPGLLAYQGSETVLNSRFEERQPPAVKDMITTLW